MRATTHGRSEEAPNYMGVDWAWASQTAQGGRDLRASPKQVKGGSAAGEPPSTWHIQDARRTSGRLCNSPTPIPCLPRMPPPLTNASLAPCYRMSPYLRPRRTHLHLSHTRNPLLRPGMISSDGRAVVFPWQRSDAPKSGHFPVRPKHWPPPGWRMEYCDLPGCGADRTCHTWEIISVKVLAHHYWAYYFVIVVLKSEAA